MVMTMASPRFQAVAIVHQLHYHHHLFHNLTAIHNMTTSVGTNPIKQVEICNDKFTQLYCFDQALQACAEARDLRRGAAFHTQLIKLHSLGSISLWNKILKMYCQSGQIQSSRRAFEKMPQRDIVSFNTMISAQVHQEHNASEVLRLYSQMREESWKPDHITLSALLGGCASSACRYLVEQIHAQSIKSGLNSNKFVGSSLVDAYSKRMRLKEATFAFNEITELDLISWNIMIDGCSSNGSEEHTMRTFSRMQREGVGFDCFTLTSIIKTCSKRNDLDRGRQLHCCVVKAGLTSETPIGNALITMYSKCKEGMDSPTQLFQRISQPNIISWTAMINGFTKNGLHKEAVGFYREMLRLSGKENEFSFASILPACSNLASLEQGKQVHARIIKLETKSDVSVGNALIDMYHKCGCLEDAELAFATMKKRDVISWTVMIVGLGQHGKGRESLEIFELMKREGLKPDGITFLGILSACSHGGLVDEGIWMFESMIEVYGVKPTREHYACVVDMLGRGGRLKEAERFIWDVGIESDSSAWEALLGACSIHGEMKLGERSAEKIMELEPERDGPYVLLSNIYAEKGMWEEKGKVRERLGDSGLRKEAAQSWVAGLEV